MSALTDEELESLLRVCDRWEVPPSVMDAMDVELFAAVEAIVATHVAAERARVDAAWRARVEAWVVALEADKLYGGADRLLSLLAEDPS